MWQSNLASHEFVVVVNALDTEVMTDTLSSNLCQVGNPVSVRGVFQLM